ncbi:hypothetical protein KR018_002796 [Drosophila ironensis]|nr:hypothetical protein KR018_002796 [Drosophila ironensis]
MKRSSKSEMQSVDLKSFKPVKVYKSTSYIYTTFISKMPLESPVPPCNEDELLEQSIVQAFDQTVCPKSYKKRQDEAKEILTKLQSEYDSASEFPPDTASESALDSALDSAKPDNSSTVGTADADPDSEDDEDSMREPVRLRSEVLLNRYKALYEYESAPVSIWDSVAPNSRMAALVMVMTFCGLALSAYGLIQAGEMNFYLW